MKTCPYCNSECKDEAVICPCCGKNVNKPRQPMRKMPVEPEPVLAPMPRKTTAQKISRKELIAVFLVIGGVLGALIALIALLLFTGQQGMRAAPLETDTVVVAREENSMIAGMIYEAADGVTPVANVNVKIYLDNELIATQASAEDGSFEIQLDPGDYQLKINAENYVEFISAVTAYPKSRNYLDTILLVARSEDEEGTASGSIVNTMTGETMDGVELTFNPGWNNFDGHGGSLWGNSIATAVTDEQGHYAVQLPLGYYTVVVSYDEFLNSFFNIIVQAGETDNQNGTITPRVEAANGEGYLITLTWGLNPNDLDSHVQGVYSGGDKFHVFFAKKDASDGDRMVCSLDYDDTSSYGPEHITLEPNTNAPYYYYVYRYAGSGTVDTSGAKVSVHRGNNLVRSFNVPTNEGNGDYWNVFAIVDNQIIVRDTITDQTELEYAP